MSAATDPLAQAVERVEPYARRHAATPPPTDAPAFGVPVVFGGTMGFLYPGDASFAVLMVGAVAYEELCVRATWRALAEAISEAGAPCLRFDLPGVGDALEPTLPLGLDDWRAGVREAARHLREATGRERIAIVGHGVGGSLAALLAPELGDVAGVAFMAPVTSGRVYLRELAIWSAVVTDVIGIGPDPDNEGGCVIGGIAIEPGRLPELKALDLRSIDVAPASRALVIGRPNHGGDERFAERLEEIGVAVDRLPYEGYQYIATDPTQARPPYPTLRQAADWIAGLAPSGGEVAAPRFVPAPAEPQALVGDGYRERPIRFGPDRRLFGVICEPETARDGPAVVFANAGRDYHIGWARTTIEQARGFARLGLASLRFDSSGIGDTPAPAGAEGELLYSDDQVGEVMAAAEEMRRRGHRRVALVGRCSGAYAALHAALRDPLVTELVMINTERFVWDPRENVQEALRYAHRSLGDFSATLMKRGGFGRLFRGELRAAVAARYVARRMLRKLAVRLAPYLGEVTEEAKLYRIIHRGFANLARRKATVCIVYSVGDLGLAERDTYFGRDGWRLGRYPNVRREMIPDADHNFTHRGARGRLFATLVRVFAS